MKLISRRAFTDYMRFREETNASLAAKAGVSTSLVALLRCGRRDSCRPENARAIEEALMAPPGALFQARVVAAPRTAHHRAGAVAS